MTWNDFKLSAYWMHQIEGWRSVFYYVLFYCNNLTHWIKWQLFCIFDKRKHWTLFGLWILVELQDSSIYYLVIDCSVECLVKKNCKCNILIKSGCYLNCFNNSLAAENTIDCMFYSSLLRKIWLSPPKDPLSCPLLGTGEYLHDKLLTASSN